MNFNDTHRNICSNGIYSNYMMFTRLESFWILLFWGFLIPVDICTKRFEFLLKAFYVLSVIPMNGRPDLISMSWLWPVVSLSAGRRCRWADLCLRRHVHTIFIDHWRLSIGECDFFPRISNCIHFPINCHLKSRTN